MKKIVLAVCLFLLITGSLFALPARIAVSDFMVHSSNPRYEFMGKGIAEMIAMELRKSPEIELIERENRSRLLQEAEFSLSDLADTATQVEVGKLLAAGYLVFGELIDMDREFLISLRMTEVESGKVVWGDRLASPLADYDYITGYFSRSILERLGVRVTETTADKLAARAPKSEEAVIALSRAIDYYDRQETEAAKLELSRARRIDPDSEAVAYYLSKLTVNTARFRVITEPYYSYDNPARLGLLEAATFSFSTGTHVYGIITHNAIENINYASFDADKSISEYDMSMHASYALPLGKKTGLRTDLVLYNRMERFWQGDYDYMLAGDSTNRWGAGAIFDLGARVGECWALGAGLGIFSGSAADHGPWDPFVNAEKVVLSGNLGLLYRTPDERLVFDTRLGISSETFDAVDPDTLTVAGESGAPVFWETGVTLALDEKTSFLSIKQINDFSLDRVYVYSRLLPAFERFFSDRFSARVGLEGSLAFLGDSAKTGYGLLGGMTFRIVRWHCDLDVNLTYRMRPSRVVENLLYPDFITLVGVSFSDPGRSRSPGP
jgi:TolB-like protein